MQMHGNLTKKKENNPALTLDGQPIVVVKSYKYLVLLLSSDLSWSAHIVAMCTKVRKLLGLLYRQFSADTNQDVMV